MKKLKNSINKLCFRTYIISGASIIFSLYYIWKETALTRLERKWVADLAYVNLFLERIRERDETVKPILFFYDSEGYFEYLFLWKIVKEDELSRARHLIKPRRH